MTSSESITNPFICCYSSPQLRWSHFHFFEYCVLLVLGRGVSFILNYFEAITLHLHQRNRLGLCIQCIILVYRNPTVSNVEGEYEHYYPLSSSIHRTCIILIVVLFVLQCLILIICSLSAIYSFNPFNVLCNFRAAVVICGVRTFNRHGGGQFLLRLSISGRDSNGHGLWWSNLYYIQHIVSFAHSNNADWSYRWDSIFTPLEFAM